MIREFVRAVFSDCATSTKASSVRWPMTASPTSRAPSCLSLGGLARHPAWRAATTIRPSVSEVTELLLRDGTGVLASLASGSIEVFNSASRARQGAMGLHATRQHRTRAGRTSPTW